LTSHLSLRQIESSMAEAAPPPFVPPPGSENDDLSPGFNAFVIAMTVMVIVSISLRFWSRSIAVRANFEHSVARFWWDDWVALASVVCLSLVLFNGRKVV
jgi:hypothetical protein